MSHSDTLLIELLTEELPPKALNQLSSVFSHCLVEQLAIHDLIDIDKGRVPSFEPFGTPRRLAVIIHNVRTVAPQRWIYKKVLPVSVALKSNGQPSDQLIKRLIALGFPDIPLTRLERVIDGKIEAFFLKYTAPGVTLEDGLQNALDETLTKLTTHKILTYQRPDGTNVQFIRPIHRLIALHANRVIPITALGLRANNITLGHRFLSEGQIKVLHADNYKHVLKHRGKVIVSMLERKEAIRIQLLERAGVDHVLMPETLLNEVNALVEWPIVYACHFDQVFLKVPQECLILTMQTNQKYFVLTNAFGKLQPRFLVVSNLQTDTPKQIVIGNERVVRSRLTDAKFFFEQDKKKTLEQRVPLLASVVYHHKLGSQLQRTERIEALAILIAPIVGVDARLAARTARLAKADLLTYMVGEFPELQGIMGAYYARYDGESEEIAIGCLEHYRPRFTGDELPSTTIGTIIAVADKIEALVGIWGIGLQPTGEKDPYALRRHALGLLRIILEKRLPIDLIDLLRHTYTQFSTHTQVIDPTSALYDFFIDRLRSLLRGYGYNAKEVEAVLSQNPTRIDNIISRLDAVREFAALPAAESLAVANKRIMNILKKSNSAPRHIKTQLFVECAEFTLFEQLQNITPTVQDRLHSRDYTGALLALASMSDSVNMFFKDVMINTDNSALRANRLGLLALLYEQMNCVADISKLKT
ncbi:Glycine--tRNA ligase beta subunit [Candidatus Vallotia tarda]|uniref:Glycine--tRNA ligase beta subunit n=2 Tax=Candidatus Vallotiella hemipterorum TaxID=1177213 RepID=A0A916JTK5_9BURK|nr:glycine--tRNA ligase subunit beta [Candidatus Vallotia tarda]CAG7597203.1 Glycine--tRNA ligase beta subunit [Candidatus Vallotia tarda]